MEVVARESAAATVVVPPGAYALTVSRSGWLLYWCIGEGDGVLLWPSPYNLAVTRSHEPHEHHRINPMHIGVVPPPQPRPQAQRAH